MTNKLREYELKVPFFGLLISWALAHSFTYKDRYMYWINKYFWNTHNLACVKLTSKTKSRNLPSISLIQNKNLLFNSPSRLSIEMSHEILWWPLTTFRMGTRAWITNCSLYHRPDVRMINGDQTISPMISTETGLRVTWSSHCSK